LRGRAYPVPVRNGTGQGLCRHSMRRSADRLVFLYRGYAGLVRLQDFDEKADANQRLTTVNEAKRCKLNPQSSSGLRAKFQMRPRYLDLCNWRILQNRVLTNSPN